MNKKYYFAVAGLLALVAAGWFTFFRQPKPVHANLDEFAQCLTEHGAVMYGAYWCPHCANQKKVFSDSFRYVTYIECADNPKVCTDAGVNSLPTWIFPQGQRLEGEQSVEKLSEESGCPLPSGGS